jgi:hypothetical protein
MVAETSGGQRKSQTPPGNPVVGRIGRLEGESTVPGDDGLGDVSKRIIAETDEFDCSPPPRTASP